MTNKIIAVDGYSSTGKSTLAKRMAKALQFAYVDTGAMYRAVTLFAMENACFEQSADLETALLPLLKDVSLHFAFNTEKGYSEIYLNGRMVEDQIRSLAVSDRVSQVAALPAVRSKLVDLQRAMGEHSSLVMDGRDIGSVVFPQADLKLFVTADPQIRAQRRHQEMLDNGTKVEFDDVLRNLRDRDHLDSTRKDSPLVQAKDAVLIDNSHMDQDQTFAEAMRIWAEQSSSKS